MCDKSKSSTKTPLGYTILNVRNVKFIIFTAVAVMSSWGAVAAVISYKERVYRICSGFTCAMC